jgi:hypothetical protein
MRLGLAVSLVAMLIAACGSSEETIDVSLYEWGVDVSPATVAAGDVTFTGKNDGSEIHEMVVAKVNSASDIPVDADGAADESQMDASVFIGEIEDIEAGSSQDVTFALEAGTYVVFCNITETESDGTVESHFQKGMFNTITVTG